MYWQSDVIPMISKSPVAEHLQNELSVETRLLYAMLQTAIWDTKLLNPTN